MDKSQVKPGMRVTARAPAPDAVVYDVLEVRGFQVRLAYDTDSGQRVEGGWIDCSALYAHDAPTKPTKPQTPQPAKF